MSWLGLTLVGILVFSPKSLLYRVLMKDDKSDPYAQSVVFFGMGGLLHWFFRFFMVDSSTRSHQVNCFCSCH